jgi:predicted ArsR family transcriptional regulator
MQGHHLKRRFSTSHRQNLALARLAKSERQREDLLVLVAADEHGSDEDFGRRLGLKPRMVRNHLKTLRESGMIAVKIERHQGYKGWMNYRTAVVTEKGFEALRRSRETTKEGGEV